MNNAIKQIVINSTGTDEQKELESLISGWYSAIKIKNNLAHCDINISHVCHDLETYKNEFSVISLNIRQIMFLRTLGVDEKMLMNTCQAQHTLGKRYSGWHNEEQDFMLVEGDYGVRFSNVQFQHFIHHIQESSFVYDDYSIAAQMARNSQFVHPVADQHSILSTYTYSLNVDSKNFIKLLIEKAKSIGIVEIQGEIEQVDAEQGRIDTISIATTEGLKKRIDSDFFIDCATESSRLFSHFDSQSIQPTHTHLAAEKCLVAAVKNNSSMPLATLIKAYSFGWSKVNSLRNSAVVECYFNNDASVPSVLDALATDNIIIDENTVLVKTLSQKIMQTSWQSNCLFLGKNSCDIEPLVHNYLDIIDEQLAHFFKVFPSKQFQPNIVSFYNRSAYEQSLSLLDIVVCHYQLSSWRQTVFWKNNAAINASNNLEHIISLFKQTGIFPEFENQYILEDIWVNFLIGFGCKPKHVDPISFHETDVSTKISSFKNYIDNFLKQLPNYEQYVNSSNKH